MVNSTATTPSQSHGGALYYVVEVPREEYLKECAAQATAMASAGGYPNPTYQAQYAAHHQQFQNVPNTTILARLNRWARVCVCVCARHHPERGTPLHPFDSLPIPFPSPIYCLFSPRCDAFFCFIVF